MLNTAPLTPGEIQRLFEAAEPPIANTFQFSLVLGGTVSAGSYTAGVLDFLIEALDCWTDAREKEATSTSPTAPRHKVLLKLIAGTSGGGVNAAIAARALAYDFPHISRGTPNTGPGVPNPFYDVWVNKLTLAGMLDTGDIDSGTFISILNGKPIDNAADLVANFTGPALKPRSWVSGPLRVILTLSNLRGIPYRTDMGNGNETFVDHADFARFAFVYPGGTIADPRPDEFVLGFDSTRLPQAIQWSQFSEYARATGAFPIGFPPRALTRPVEHYRYRATVVPSDQPGAPARIVGRVLDWDTFRLAGGGLQDDYHFLTVDGGATNNEPIELARTALSGLTGRNPRGSTEADRAVVLVDPFAGQTGLGPEKMSGFPGLFGSLMSMFTQQTRYASQDMVLASDDNVFSRFMIVPRRGDLTGGEAIASDGLGAFIGFGSPDFMRHDYLLGRRNCQKFLQSEFVMDAENPVFKDVWTAAQKAKFGIKDAFGRLLLPLVPLMGDAAVEEVADPWPRHALNPDDYHDAIEDRFKAILEFEGKGGVISSSLAWILAHAAEDTVAKFAVNKIRDALEKAGLA